MKIYIYFSQKLFRGSSKLLLILPHIFAVRVGLSNRPKAESDAIAVMPDLYVEALMAPDI